MIHILEILIMNGGYVMCIQEKFLKELGELKENYKRNSEVLRKDNKKDEAVFENIRFNVCDIFTTLFNVSHKKSFRPNQSQEDYLEKLNSAYTGFFESIPASWKENMKKAKENEVFDEYHKEEIKLETLKIIMDIFNRYYSEYKKEDYNGREHC